MVSGSVYFSLMSPGARLRAHCGPTNSRLRVHLALAAQHGTCGMRVGNESRLWREGEVLGLGLGVGLGLGLGDAHVPGGRHEEIRIRARARVRASVNLSAACRDLATSSGEVSAASISGEESAAARCGR